ncbi:MAG TPA: hypothetical protein HPP97_08125 [Desulfuromonadales bacterium]|nr:hypothetical protein [Desulfuromonadales bacterium]
MTISRDNLKNFFENEKIRSVCVAVMLVSFSAVLTLHLIKPLYDPDFFWHLKTGFWIWDNKGLPAVDPFSINPQQADSHRTWFILSSYWLFQLVLCAFYKLGGFNGIIFLRFILAGILIAVFYRFSVRKNILALLAAGIGITQILDSHFPERPQFISFICSAILLSLLFTHLRERKKKLLPLMVPLCLTMLVWANSHGGFLLGLILLACILLAETVKFIHPRLLPLSGREYAILGTSISAAILISFVNPSHIYSLEMVLPAKDANSFIYTSILEFSSLYECFKSAGGYEPIIALCTYIFAVIVAFQSRDRLNITWLALIVLLGYMGFSHVRYYPFFLICVSLFALQYVDAGKIGKAGKTAVALFFIAVVSTSLAKTPENLDRVLKYGWVPASYFPVKSCDYINANGMNGNVFTTLDWGGYVLWRLSPQQKIYIDGRQLDPSRSWEYFYNMDNWKKIFDKYDIRVVITPVMDELFKPASLKQALDADPGWRLVNTGNNGAVFVRK